jgi:penicillin-binding protein 1A
VLYGTGTGAEFGRSFAGKTGTTTNYTDAWFIGYTPKLTAAVWMGYPQAATAMMNLRGVSGGVDGGSIPASLFRRFMAAVTRNGDYTGSFDTNFSFTGKIIGPPTGIFYPLGTGATSTVPATTPTTGASSTTSTPATSTPATSTPATRSPATYPASPASPSPVTALPPATTSATKPSQR